MQDSLHSGTAKAILVAPSGAALLVKQGADGWVLRAEIGLGAKLDEFLLNLKALLSELGKE